MSSHVNDRSRENDIQRQPINGSIMQSSSMAMGLHFAGFLDKNCIFQVEKLWCINIVIWWWRWYCMCIINLVQHKDHAKNDLKTFYCNSESYHIPKMPWIYSWQARKWTSCWGLSVAFQKGVFAILFFFAGSLVCCSGFFCAS